MVHCPVSKLGLFGYFRQAIVATCSARNSRDLSLPESEFRLIKPLHPHMQVHELTKKPRMQISRLRVAFPLGSDHL